MQRSELHDQAAWAREQLADAMQGCHRLERITPVDGVACPECGIYFDCESSMRKHKSRKHPDIEKTAPVDMTTLPRELFCVDGMPICRGCGKQFHHMQTLLRHVANRRCPGLTAILNRRRANPRKQPRSPFRLCREYSFLKAVRVVARPRCSMPCKPSRHLDVNSWNIAVSADNGSLTPGTLKYICRSHIKTSLTRAKN